LNKKSLVTAFAAIALTFLGSGCGTTRKLLSITGSSTPLTTGVTIANSRNLFGIGGSEQIFIIATFTGSAILHAEKTTIKNNAAPQRVLKHSSNFHAFSRCGAASCPS